MELVKNKDGKEIPLSSTGTKLVNIGKLTISDGVFTTELVSDYAAKDDTTYLSSPFRRRMRPLSTRSLPEPPLT